MSGPTPNQTSQPATTPSSAPVSRRRLRAGAQIAALLFAVCGAFIMCWGFLQGIGAALDGSGNGPGLYVAVFLVGATLVLIAIVTAIVGLVRPGPKTLPVVTLTFAALPVIALIVIGVAARVSA